MKKNGFLILIISMLFSGCSNRSVMLDISEPKKLINHSFIVPNQGITITSPLHLSGRIDILGGGSIKLKGEGRIVVEKNSKVTIRGASIDASEIKVADGEGAVFLIAINEGEETSLELEDSSFLVDIPYEKDGSDAPWDQSAKYFAIGIVESTVEPVSKISFSVRNSKFINRNAYAAGAMSLMHRIRIEKESTLTGEILGSEFEGFHGVISGNKMKSFKISGNQLSRNSFANVFVSGEDVEVSNNMIYYPGHGTTGDGVTVLGRFVDSKIIGNTIFVGSCFGMLIKGGEISNILIEGNSIINGVTTAIQVEGTTANVSNVVIRKNMMAGNFGFAVTFLKVENSIIERNNFSGNARGFPSQVYIEKSPGVFLSDNLSADALTPEWANGLELYRSHVKADNTSFTLPGSRPD